MFFCNFCNLYLADCILVGFFVQFLFDFCSIFVRFLFNFCDLYLADCIQVFPLDLSINNLSESKADLGSVALDDIEIGSRFDNTDGVRTDRYGFLFVFLYVFLIVFLFNFFVQFFCSIFLFNFFV